MWIPADLVYLGTAGTLFMRWLLSLEAHDPRREQALRPAPVTPAGRFPALRPAVGDGADQEGGA
jgi:hypothetical protein